MYQYRQRIKNHTSIFWLRRAERRVESVHEKMALAVSIEGGIVYRAFIERVECMWRLGLVFLRGKALVSCSYWQLTMSRATNVHSFIRSDRNIQGYGRTPDQMPRVLVRG